MFEVRNLLSMNAPDFKSYLDFNNNRSCGSTDFDFFDSEPDHYPMQESSSKVQIIEDLTLIEIPTESKAEEFNYVDEGHYSDYDTQDNGCSLGKRELTTEKLEYESTNYSDMDFSNQKEEEVVSETTTLFQMSDCSPEPEREKCGDDLFTLKFSRKQLTDSFRTVLRACLKVEIAFDIDEAVKVIHGDSLTRKYILWIYGKQTHQEISLEDFRQLIDEEVPNWRRKDELQKKVYSKWTWLIYHSKFKKTSRTTKTQALSDIKKKYKLQGLAKVEVFERIWGEEKKKGMYNGMITELLTNNIMIKDLLSVEYLEDVLESMHEQTESDIEVNLVQKFALDPNCLSKCLANTRIEETECQDSHNSKKSTKVNKEQSVKLPWSIKMNTEALTIFLDKLLHRALIEKLPIHSLIQSRIDHFTAKLTK
jgi:hypothetical protein